MSKMPVVNEDLCIGCGHCNEVCPQVFELVDEKSQVIGPDKCGTCNCQEAIDTCPVQAISWKE
jgi:ferredoxin